MSSAAASSSSSSSISNLKRGGKLFEKILIANRGEIACRIMRTCKKLGIKTVAIYSEPDKNAVHVETADEAVCVGPAASTESYLSIPNIVKACQVTGAQAVHPGFGFLSENKHFQIALKEAGIKFLGPDTHAISVMGDKISSKTAAKAAGVNIIPGHLGKVETSEEIIRIAREIGYPVMVKASGGGGGKGMRIARNDQEAVDGFRLSQQEALSAFGNGTMFIEKFIEEPRHIEFQVLADQFGNALYLNERECTIQRRNQKVIEEAPSTFLTPELRRQMGEQAVGLAKAVGYESAGTVEFLVDKHRKFYYLEMNTRLQVEHPTTELITGLDLVELMIRVGSGQALPLSQNEVGINGWALEARVYAEDPLKGFLPSIGKLKRYVEPTGQHVRVDTGVKEGSEISVHYDPMIAKIITWGQDRPQSFQNMRDALDSIVVRGVTHNVNFLRSLCDHPRFIKGNITTNFIPEEYPQGYKGLILTPELKQELVAASIIVQSRVWLTQLTTSAKLNSFSAEDAHRQQLTGVRATFGSDVYHLDCLPQPAESDAEQKLTVSLTSLSYEGKPVLNAKPTLFTVSGAYQRGDLSYKAIVNGNTLTLQVMEVSEGEPKVTIMKSGTSFNIKFESAREAELRVFMPSIKVLDTSKMIMSPMPGVVFAINVKAGDEVVPGQEVAIVEAMKMQNALRSEVAGKVKAVDRKSVV